MGIVTSIVVSLIVAAVSIALSELLRPKPKLEEAKPAGLGDFNFPTAIEGRPIPVLFGTVKVRGPNVVWYGDLRQVAIRKTIKAGLWSSDRITTGFRYFVGVQLALCLGEIDNVNKMWVGDTLVYGGPPVQDGTFLVNEPLLFGGEKLGTGGMVGTVRVYPGTQTQTADAYLAQFQTPSIPYRGTCYLVWQGGLIGNSTQLKPWSFELERFPNQLGLTGGNHIVNGADANPACVIYEYLTNTDWGLRFPAADVDVSSFTSAGNTLFSEGNGYSFLLDRALEGFDFLSEVERQIDGKVLFDMQTGKWLISLARGGYDPDAIFQLDSSNIREVVKYDAGTWEGTINDIRVNFTDRAKDYFETSVRLDDLANIRVQGQTIASELSYPGVKDKTLASKICARELMLLSVPLKSATILADRTAWTVKPVDVVAWTDANFGFVKLPMRVQAVDLGELDDGTVKLQLMQDIFGFSQAVSGIPDTTFWTPPVQGVAAYPANQQVVIEAPYAFARRDEQFPSILLDRLWCGARVQASETHFKIYQRNHPTTPAGAYLDSGEVFGFMLVGELRTALTDTPAVQGTVVVEVNPVPDAVITLEDAFTVNPTPADLGQNLINLFLIGDEFFAARTVVNNSTWLSLNNGYRGLLDSKPKSHSVNDRVFMLFVGGGMSFVTIPQTNVVDVQLRGVSRTDEVTEGAATTVQIQFANRARRAYVPTELEINTVRYESTPDPDDLKVGGSGLDDRGLEFDFVRRDYRQLDEVAQLTVDAASLANDFPTANTHENQLTLIEDGETLSSGLVSAWNLGEASGTRFDSITTTPNDLSDNNTVGQQSPGKVGDAAIFVKANSEFLEKAAASELTFGDVSFTVAFWFWLDDNTANQALVGKFNANGVNEREWAVFFVGTPTNRVRFIVSNDGTATTVVDSPSQPSQAAWHHCIAWHDPTANTINLQVDGGVVQSVAHTTGIHQLTGNPFWIGKIGIAAGDLFLDGRIDAAQVWSRLLTPVERIQLYAAGDGQEYAFPVRRQLDQVAWSAFNNAFFSRARLIEVFGGTLPTVPLRVQVEARHTFDTVVFAAKELLEHDFTLDTSDLDALESLGVVASATATSTYVAPSTETLNLEIGTALGGAVEAQINGGGWTSVIAASSLTGTLAVTAGDDVEFRHQDSTPPPDRTLFLVKNASSVSQAYAVFVMA